MPNRFRQPLALGLLAALQEAAWVTLRSLHPFDVNLVETVAVLWAAAVVYFAAVWLVFFWRQAARGVLLVVILAAAIFRLTLLPLPPSLSDDLYRYEWEGKIQLAGKNAYLATPSDLELVELRPPVYDHLPGKELPTAYGPAIELLFRLAASADGLFAFKFLSVLFDFGSVLLLVWLLRVRGQPPVRALVYAWCPLVVLEFAGSGHNDSIPVFFLLLACALALRTWAASATALAAAALSKWFAGLLAPVFFRQAAARGRAHGWRWLLLFTAAVVLLCLPYLGASGGLFAGLLGYAAGWRNNASLFTLLAGATGSDVAAQTVALVVVGGLVLAFTLRGSEPLRASLVLLVALLLVSPSVFPWYLTWFVPSLCFFPSPALLLWTSTVLLSYHILLGFTALGVWEYKAEFLWLEYVPVYALLLLAGWRARHRWHSRGPS
jgi:hypothetical protein